MELTRRGLLAGAGAVGLSATMGAGSASQAAGPAPGDPDYVLLNLFNNSGFNGQISFCLGGSGCQTAEIGEVMYAVNRINAKTGNPGNPSMDPPSMGPTAKDFEILVQEFVDLGDRLERLAKSAGKQHRVTYRQRMMRASSYVAQSLFFVLGGTEPDNEAEYFRICQDRWLKAARMMDRPVETFEVSTPFGEVPCYFLPATSGSGRRPTLIISSGSDGQLVECMSFGVAAGLDRGYNVVLFEGPGQMRLLFEEGIPFTPRWDKVIGPILERVRRRNDVGRVGLVGVSFAGMLCASAYARLTLDAVVLLPAAWNATLLWGDQTSMGVVKQTHRLPAAEKAKAVAGVNAGFEQAWASMPRVAQFDIYKRGEIYSPQVMREARAGKTPSDYYGLLEAMLPFVFDRDYRRGGWASSPIMLTRNQGDIFFNGGSGEPPTPTTGKYDQPTYAFGLLKNVPDRRKKFVDFTLRQGATLHDQPLAPQFATEVMFDWLDSFM